MKTLKKILFVFICIVILSAGCHPPLHLLVDEALPRACRALITAPPEENLPSDSLRMKAARGLQRMNTLMKHAQLLFVAFSCHQARTMELLLPRALLSFTEM